MRDAGLLIETLRLSPRVDRVTLAAAWDSADAGALVRLVEREGVVQWLSRRLKALGITLPGEPGKQLAATVKRGIAQSLRMDAETATTLGLLDAAGIHAIPLKGAAMRRLVPRVPYADARVPNDVDLLVPEADARRAFDVLVSRGYQVPKDENPADHHHLPALVGSIGIAVELHTSTSPAVAPAEAWRRASAMDDTELLWHAASHAVADTDDNARNGSRLKTFLDAAALFSAGATVDWTRVRERLDSGEVEYPAAVRAWLAAAADLGGVPPAESRPLNLERLVAWKLRVLAREDGRWGRRLIEEGARGEFGLPVEPSSPRASAAARARHVVVTRAARAFWMVAR